MSSCLIISSGRWLHIGRASFSDHSIKQFNFVSDNRPRDYDHAQGTELLYSQTSIDATSLQITIAKLAWCRTHSVIDHPSWWTPHIHFSLPTVKQTKEDKPDYIRVHITLFSHSQQMEGQSGRFCTQTCQITWVWRAFQKERKMFLSSFNFKAN